jgi:hypothetical protein
MDSNIPLNDLIMLNSPVLDFVQPGRAMSTYLLVANGADQNLVDLEGHPPAYYAKQNNHLLTEQIVTLFEQQRATSHSPDIQRFLESFGFVSKLDMFDAFSDISARMARSLTTATEELTDEDDLDDVVPTGDVDDALLGSMTE